MKDACSVDDPVYKRAFREAFYREIENASDASVVSFYSKRGWETRIWPCCLAKCGPVNVDANGAPVEAA